MTHYFLFAGEASGDLHGSRLIQALQTKENSSSISGLGGPRMRQEAFECLMKMEEFQVMGLSDVLKSLPRLWKNFYRVRDFILKAQPDCVILIDYPGFNLRLAKALRKAGFKNKLVQYICPTVWAHGKERIKVLTDYYDLLLTIYPFETAYFTKSPLKVKYVGNPLAETIQSHFYQKNWQAQINLPASEDLIALFPGSRLEEIQRHVPQQLEAAAQLKLRHPHLCFAISCAQESLYNPLLTLVRKGPLILNEDLYIVPPRHHYDLMKTCKTALAKSGTVTLELALHCVPTVVHYELSALNYLFAKYLLRLNLPYYCMVNILSNEMIFPELIGRHINPKDLYQEMINIHFNSAKYQETRKACEKLKTQLGTQPSHEYAAIAIQEMMSC